MSNTHSIKRVCKLARQAKAIRNKSRNGNPYSYEYLDIPEYRTLVLALIYGPHNYGTKRSKKCYRKLHRHSLKSKRQKLCEDLRRQLDE